MSYWCHQFPPKNEQKQVDLRYHSSKVEFFRSFLEELRIIITDIRECVRNLDLRVQVHPGKLWVSKQRVHIVLEASKSAGAKDDVPKICGFMHPLHPF